MHWYVRASTQTSSVKSVRRMHLLKRKDVLDAPRKGHRNKLALRSAACVLPFVSVWYFKSALLCLQPP